MWRSGGGDVIGTDGEEVHLQNATILIINIFS
jgi:hypothetical protein